MAPVPGAVRGAGSAGLRALAAAPGDDVHRVDTGRPTVVDVAGCIAARVVIGGRVLDVTAIRDMTIGRTVYGGALVAYAVREAVPLVVPAAALQEAWAAAGVDDYPFLQFLLELPVTVVEPLTAASAEQSGVLASDVHAASQWDAAAAHTVQVAQTRGLPVVTADPAPLRALDVALPVELLPDA